MFCFFLPPKEPLIFQFSLAAKPLTRLVSVETITVSLTPKHQKRLLRTLISCELLPDLTLLPTLAQLKLSASGLAEFSERSVIRPLVMFQQGESL